MQSNQFGTILPAADHVDIVVPGKPRAFRKQMPGTTLTFAWQDVARVIAFKRDCFTVDSIRFVFELNGTQTIEVSEEMMGWQALVDAVPHHLPGALAQEEWWTKVAFPAFAPCITEVYSRP